MYRAPYILASSLKEAHRFAREMLNLERGQYRVVNSASTVSSVRGVDLHLVPGWENRYDKFAMRGALRWTKMDVITHLAEDLSIPSQPDEPQGSEDEVPAVEAVPDNLNPPGEQFAIEVPATGVDVEEFFNIVEEEAEEPIRDDEIETPAKGKRVRRRRCPKCNGLFLKENLEDHPCVEEG